MRAFVTHFPSPPPKLEIGSKACRRETPLNFRVEPRASAAASYISVLIIPTGMGASIGGYAGDAIPVLRLIASIADNVITHPNVLNGALMYWPLSNAMYVDGYTLDQFAAGRCALKKNAIDRIARPRAYQRLATIAAARTDFHPRAVARPRNAANQ